MKPLETITEREFRAFEGVRRSGVCNMWSPQVENLAHISKDTHLGIIHHYEALAKKWPDVVEARGQ